jgi:hypothetical protein
MGDFLPLPGNLSRLTEFTCASGGLDLSYYPSSGCAPPPIFAEPERVSLRKLTAECCRPTLDGITVQDLRLTRIRLPWPKGPTFIPQGHSLTTLINCTYFGPEQPPFTLPNLMYLDTVGFAILGVARTPNLQTLVVTDIYEDESANIIVWPPCLPALTTLCVRYGDLTSEEITGLLALNTGIRRLMLSGCIGISDLVRLLKADDTGSAANTLDIMLLPSLSLLHVCDSPASDVYGFHPLLVAPRYASNTVKRVY